MDERDVTAPDVAAALTWAHETARVAESMPPGARNAACALIHVSAERDAIAARLAAPLPAQWAEVEVARLREELREARREGEAWRMRLTEIPILRGVNERADAEIEKLDGEVAALRAEAARLRALADAERALRVAWQRAERTHSLELHERDILRPIALDAIGAAAAALRAAGGDPAEDHDAGFAALRSAAGGEPGSKP